MRIVAIIQARMTSTRLPGKVMADLCGEPMLEHMLGRVRRAERVDGIMVATTTNGTDDSVVALCRRLNVPVFRGDEADVLGRYAGAAADCGADVVVRLTADCPMIDPEMIDEAVSLFADSDVDYLSNSIEQSWPDGLDIEIFTRDALERANREATLPYHREHVTPWLRTGCHTDVPTGEFRLRHMRNDVDFSHLRWTVDTQDDLDRVRALVGALPADYSWRDALALAGEAPDGAPAQAG